MGYGRFKQKFSPQSLGARSGCKTRRAAAVLELVGPPGGELVGVEFVITDDCSLRFRFAQENVVRI
jgi:hypothetical protein